MKLAILLLLSVFTFAASTEVIGSPEAIESPEAIKGAEVVAFSDESLRPRYQQLLQELRCPKCQNQNLADSNSPISQDLRREIQRMLEEQMTDKQIKDYLKSRYSEFILYRPEVNKNTWLLWGSPVLVVLLGLLILLRHNRKPEPSAENEVPTAGNKVPTASNEVPTAIRGAGATDKEAPTNSSDQQRLAELLGDKENQQ
ncbi:cytochrome c-type biogenesis protein CcmH [Porticoccaceae bacterium]|nr:cytochrome c-type biogenesis protein CcmH [Porticoccaceae bacterium]